VLQPAPASRAPVSVVVLTHNEERNLEVCLRSVADWCAGVFVVDSGSTDRTIEIAARWGATVVAHPFETHARQWEWALASLPLTTDWVLALDADQQVTPELESSIVEAFRGHRQEGVDAFFVARRQVFRGRWIRHGGYYPKWLLKLVRRSRVTTDATDLVDHHFIVPGRVGRLTGDLIEDNRNEAEIAAWTTKHNRYAQLQARQELMAEAAGGRLGIGALFGHADARTAWRKQQWRRLPLFVRPCLYVFYRYVLRLGFLDGREGFIFHVLQAFWYRLLVDINIVELRPQMQGEPGISRCGETAPVEPPTFRSGDSPDIARLSVGHATAARDSAEPR
jgi:glycosyltransferase involved in cell wall biosynthesis